MAERATQLQNDATARGNMAKFDDASWHSGAKDFPKNVPEENAATHIGMFLQWAIRKGLFADPEVPEEPVEAVKLGTASGRDFLFNYCDGKLFSGLFSEEGADFAERHYSDFLDDYRQLLCGNLKSDYFVENTDQNYATMAKALDERWSKYRKE